MPPELCKWIVAGAAGAFVKLCADRNGVLLLPRWGRTAGGRLYIDLGFLSALVVGIGAALVADGNWLTAFCAALGLSYVIEAVPARVSALRKKMKC